jgi:REP element-mobilizing transposase RayT
MITLLIKLVLNSIFNTMGESYQIKNQNALYYMTFQVVGWADVFTRRSYKDILIDSFEYCIKEKGLELFAYVIMSNHVHVIMRSTEGNLSGIVRDFKKYTARKIIHEITSSGIESRKEWLMLIFKYHAAHNRRSAKYQFWTHENHAIELDTNDMIDSKLNYIHMNPVRAGLVLYPEEYRYSSATNYANLDSQLQIEII